MDQVTQQNAAMVEESTAASRNLAAETTELTELSPSSRRGHRPPRRTATLAPHPVAKVAGTRRPQSRRLSQLQLEDGARSARAGDASPVPKTKSRDWQEF